MQFLANILRGSSLISQVLHDGAQVEVVDDGHQHVHARRVTVSAVAENAALTVLLGNCLVNPASQIK